VTKNIASATLVLSALAMACQQTPESQADTTVSTTSSSTIQTLGGASVSDTLSGSAGVPGKPVAGSKSIKPASSAGKAGTQIKSPPADDPSILGRDSVIRGFPMKGLPTASSTPTR